MLRSRSGKISTTAVAALLGVAVLLGATTVYLLMNGSPAARLDRIAGDYLALALALEQLNEGEVDSYFGPASVSARQVESLPELNTLAQQLQADLASLEVADAESRKQALQTRLEELVRITGFLQDPAALTFAEEAVMLYGVRLAELKDETELDGQGRVVYIDRPPTATELRRREILEELSGLLPGQGSLPFRVASFQAQLLVPLERREQVFERAMAACRERTLAHWQLPASEQLAIEWTRDVSVPWHRYLGGGQSLLQINPLAMGYIGSMLEVACHEGYPGHHAQFLLMEDAAAETGGLALEDQLVLLRTPLAAFLEGAAELAAELAFPADSRLTFERDVLFPLAGLDPQLAVRSQQVHSLLRELGFSTIPTLQAFSDGRLPRTAAAVRLESETLTPSPMGLLDHVQQFGAYSVGYTLARQQIAEYLAANAANEDETWHLLEELLADPRPRLVEIYTE